MTTDSNVNELLARIDLLSAAARDAADLAVEIVGTGYSSTVPLFQLAGNLEDLYRQCENVKARAVMIARYTP